MGGSRFHLGSVVRLAAALALVAGAALAAGACKGAQPVATITYRLQPESGQTVTSAQLDITVQILRDRLDGAGLGDVQVRAVSPDEVQVGLPQGVDRGKVEAVTSPTGQLEFVALPPDMYGTTATAGPREVPARGDAIDPTLAAQFTGVDIDPAKVRARYDAAMGWTVDFGWKDEAAARFEAWTGSHVGEYFAIVVDGRVMSAPAILAPISGGEGTIHGLFTEESAKSLAAVLQSGALPVPMAEPSFEDGW